jgi:hypothetical protein
MFHKPQLRFTLIPHMIHSVSYKNPLAIPVLRHSHSTITSLAYLVVPVMTTPSGTPQAAIFTIDESTHPTLPVQCNMGKDCKSGNPEHPPGTKLAYMASHAPNKPGRMLCPTCSAYYQLKSTMRRTGMMTIVFL